MPVVRPTLSFEPDLPVELDGNRSKVITMRSDIGISKTDMIANLLVSGTGSTGPGSQEFRTKVWLDQGTRISANASAGNVIISPVNDWGGTEFSVEFNNSYSQGTLSSITWDE